MFLSPPRITFEAKQNQNISFGKKISLEEGTLIQEVVIVHLRVTERLPHLASVSLETMLSA